MSYFDQAACLGVWERPDQDSIHESKDRRGRSNAQGERESDRHRKPGLAREATQRVARFENRIAIHIAAPPSDRPAPLDARADNSRPAKRARAELRPPRKSWDRSRRRRTRAP